MLSDYLVNLKQLKVQISLKSWLMALLRSSSEAPGFFRILLIATSWCFHLPLYTVPYPPSPILFLMDSNLDRNRDTNRRRKNVYLISQLLVASASSARSTTGTDPVMKLELAVLIPPRVAFVMSDIPT